MKDKRIFLYLIFCFLIYSLWAIITPFNGAPDEFMRWEIVNYMVENRSLPRGDEPSIRNDMWGVSYAFTPFVPQMISAALYIAVDSVLSLPWSVMLYIMRLPSILFSLGTVFLVYKIGMRLFSTRAARFLTVLVSLWPQFAFISSYINNDAFGIFTISLIIYAWIYGLQNKWTWKSCIMLAVGLGLCFISYYNAYGFILLSAPLFLLTAIKKGENKIYYLSLLKKISCMLLIVVAIAAWFFIRNAILYDGDFFGLRASAEASERYAEEWLRPSVRHTYLVRGFTPLGMLLHTQFVIFSYNSFIGVFGYLEIFPPSIVFFFFTVIITLGGVGIVYCIIEWLLKKEKKREIDIFLTIITISISVPIVLSVIYSFSIDYQPQGRYVLPALIPLCILITKGISTLWANLPKEMRTKRPEYVVYLCMFLANAACIYAVYYFFHIAPPV
ncbi:MAG: glycosyltransferase family 39 protein [Oscillospiraceae bacterium]|nr:glycosyltransferase family 39 protein [Oscillospiraceae bacterium]MCL2279455.1 glycosyltransferase family 39 protein [Oscillospiraceae bacterium]